MSLHVDGAASCVIPTGAVSSYLPSIIEFAAANGAHFEKWQQQILRALSAVDKNGDLLCRQFGVSIPRQAGKTFLAGWYALWFASKFPDRVVIWTSHHFSLLEHTFLQLGDLAGAKSMHTLVDPDHGIYHGKGNEEIRFRNGSKILFRARERNAVRGMDKLALIIYDEAQILTDRAIRAIAPTQLRAQGNSIQALFLGTPPTPSDPSEVFTKLRESAHKVDNHAWVEFSADKDADPTDRAQWRKANPSFPAQTSEAGILDLYYSLAPDDFRREVLGIWDEHQVGTVAINKEKWAATSIPLDKVPDGGVLSLGIDMPPDRRTLTIGACLKYEDGRYLIQMARISDPAHEGIQPTIEWIRERKNKLASIVIDGQSPAMSLLPDLQAVHMKPMITTTSDLGRACGRVLDLLDQQRILHLPDTDQPQLAEAVKNATTRKLGNSGALAFNKIGSDADISPLVACTLALWGASTSKRHPGRKQIFSGA